MRFPNLLYTLPFLVPHKELHPVGRPFAHVLSAGWDLVSLTHFVLVYTKCWRFCQRFTVLPSTFKLILNKFLKLFFRQSCPKSGFIGLFNNTFIQFFVINLFHFRFHKTKTPECLVPGFCVILYCNTRLYGTPQTIIT